MSQALRRVSNWAKQAPKALSRWPGAATRVSTGTKAGEIDFRKGVVTHVTDLSIFVDLDHPLYKAVKLMGDSYAHFCEHCKKTIPGNVTYNRSADSISHKGYTIPIRYFCPWCGPDHPLRMLRLGDKLRVHYRFDPEGQWAGWYAEVWEW